MPSYIFLTNTIWDNLPLTLVLCIIFFLLGRLSAKFSWANRAPEKEEDIVIESDQDVILLFPSDSSDHNRDEKVEAYLKKLCEKHKSKSSTFVVTGHTDNKSSEEKNLKLGLSRANSVAKVLISNGIDASRITTQSKGESEPVATNDTKEGRQQNRRTVITVVNR